MSQVDLSHLAVERRQTGHGATIAPRRRWVVRYVLPLGLLLVFVGLLTWAARDSLLPATPVRVVPVVVTQAEVRQEGTPLFQAAGWVEPRPAPVVVSSLAPGMIEELLVVEGQSVRRGEPLARLLDTDARIELSDAQATLRLRAADVESAEAELEAAKLALANPLKLQSELAAAQSTLAQVDAQLDSLPAALQSARKQRELAQQNYDNKQFAGDAIAGRLLRQAEAELAEATATLEKLTIGQPILKRQRDALSRQVDALQSRLDLKLDQKQRLAAANAALKAAGARQSQAEVAVEAAELQLARMTVKAPFDGRVLSLAARPGMRLSGINPHSESGSSAVAVLYDPASLQVRVDVRLQDVPQVAVGLRARIETAAFPNGLQGRVVAVTSLADIQKNTLQVKVAVDDPPDLLRPEMLAQVTLLAPPRPTTESDDSEQPLRLLVPRPLVVQEEGGNYLWVADQQSSTAQRRTVTLGRAGTDELVEVVSGLTPTDKLISSDRQGLSEGQRIHIEEEEATPFVADAASGGESKRR